MLVLLGAGSAEKLVAIDSLEDILDLSRGAMVSVSDWGQEVTGLIPESSSVTYMHL